MSAVKSFSLPDEAILVLDNIPKRERSEFVASAILASARHKAKLQALDAIKGFSRINLNNGGTVIETVRSIRQEAK